jgi:endoglucanase
MKNALRLVAALVVAATAIVAPGLADTGAASAAVPAPVLQVQGNRLVNTTTNTTFIPRGVNIPGLEYSGVQNWQKLPATGEFAAIASWKINTVRLPLNESCWLGLDGAPSKSDGTPGNYTMAQYRASVRSWVDGATAAGLAVILDLHWNAPAGYTASGQRAMPDERSSGFWSSVATAYAGNASVMFELFN